MIYLNIPSYFKTSYQANVHLFYWKMFLLISSENSLFSLLFNQCSHYTVSTPAAPGEWRNSRCIDNLIDLQVYITDAISVGFLFGCQTSLQWFPLRNSSEVWFFAESVFRIIEKHISHIFPPRTTLHKISCSAEYFQHFWKNVLDKLCHDLLDLLSHCVHFSRLIVDVKLELFYS